MREQTVKGKVKVKVQEAKNQRSHYAIHHSQSEVML
jgi:hypothetical protein